MTSIRSKISELTNPRNTYADIAFIVGRLNRRLQGWANYFRRGNSAIKFAHIDAYVHERLMIWMSHKHGLQPSGNWFEHFDQMIAKTVSSRALAHVHQNRGPRRAFRQRRYRRTVERTNDVGVEPERQRPAFGERAAETVITVQQKRWHRAPVRLNQNASRRATPPLSAEEPMMISVAATATRSVSDHFA